ncbi:autotransporter assembly complex protein TamA [Sphingomonas sp. ID0503]|uniref:autotransporter assembly complex protein TamA n=1 Tax=Sphingomonas sp. ID0503 TaxID=3399691 RepID=UPI003AFAA0A9
MPVESARHRVRSFALAAFLTSAPPLGAQTPPEPAGSLDPGSPLAPLPDLGVDWPELGADEPVAATPTASAAGAKEAAKSDEGISDYAVSLEGIDGIDPALMVQFDSLSTLKGDKKGDASLAQLDRRASNDADLLKSLLVSRGYYDAEVFYEIAGENKPRVTLTAQPGPRFTFAAVTLDGLPATDRAAFESAFGVKSGDPIDAEKVNTGLANLRAALTHRGYPFAKVDEPAIVIDRQADNGTLALAIQSGEAARFGKVVIQGQKRVFGPKHVQQIARFRPGDRYDAALIEDLRRALVATGLVSSVVLKPTPGANPGTVDIVTELTPAPPRTIALEAGYGTGEGVRVEASWQHRNFFRPEGAVTFRGVAGTREQYLGTQFRRGNFRQRDQVLTASAFASHSNFNAYDARTVSLAAGIERQTNIIWQKKWVWSYGAEFVGSDERAFSTQTGVTARRTYLIAALPTRLAYDGTDDLLDPTTGYRLSARLSPEASLRQGSQFYARAQIDASAYQPVTPGIVLAGRLRFGFTPGAQTDDIAPSRRFYAGGGGSVRGYGYQRIGPRDVDNDPIGGRSLTEFSAEARFRFGDFGVVPFIDGGNLYRAALPKLSGMRYGAGLGVRYYTSFGPVRIDVGTPLNRRPGDSRVAVYVSLGQAF